jgi:hypothetical protein
MIASHADRHLTPAERSQLLTLIDRPAAGVVRNAFIEHKSGSVSAGDIRFGPVGQDGVMLRPHPIGDDPRKNCVLRLGATSAPLDASGDAEILLFDAWVKSIAVMSLLADDFIEDCDAGIALTSHAGEVAMIYIPDPTDSQLDCVAFSSSAPPEWLQRGWAFTSTELQPDPI